jgi:hypothetical protein
MSNGPGPGSYSPKEIVTSRGFGIGKGNRTSFITAKELPGPGEYNPSHPVQMIIRTAKLDLSARRPLGVYDNTPGPGTYDIPGLADSGLKLSLSGRRGELLKVNGAPGPGAYDPTFSHIDNHRAMASIGSSHRTDLTRGFMSPGPKYDVRTQPKPPFWSFRKEGPKMEQFIDGVGPGEYTHVPTVPDAPKYAFFTSKK